jgi:hypothetical protein
VSLGWPLKPGKHLGFSCFHLSTQTPACLGTGGGVQHSLVCSLWGRMTLALTIIIHLTCQSLGSLLMGPARQVEDEG